MDKHFLSDSFEPIEITPELEKKIQYALMLADRAEKLSTNPAYTHMTKAYPAAIREGIAVMRGEVKHRAETSLGLESMLDQQIAQMEYTLNKAAKEIHKQKS